MNKLYKAILPGILKLQPQGAVIFCKTGFPIPETDAGELRSPARHNCVTFFTRLFFIIIFSVNGFISQAQVTITAASAGTGISADRAANAALPLYTVLGDINISEGVAGDFPVTAGTKTLILTAPAGWVFNPGAGTITSGGSADFNTLSLSVTSSTITISFDVAATAVTDVLTISGIEVQASDGSIIPLAGQLYNATGNAGTGVITGISSTSNTDGSGGTNFGSLSQVPGDVSKLAFTTQPGAAVAGSVFGQQPVIKTGDQFGSFTTAGLATSQNVAITLSSGTGVLSGTSTLDIGTASGNGTVSFSNLQLDAGGAKMLTASSPLLSDAVSNSFTVGLQSTSIILSPDNNPSCFGDNLTLTATFNDNLVTGTAEFFNGATSIGTAIISGGVATLSLNTLPAGTLNLTAGYPGDGTYDASTSNTLIQVVNSTPPPTWTSQTFCAINNPTLGGLSVSGSGVQWYANASGGSVIATNTTLVNGTHYYASQTLSGCESLTRLDVIASVDDPAPPVGSAAQNFCAIDNPTIAGLAATGTGIQWYASTVGGAPMESTTLLATSHYFATQTISGCESDTRLDVLATVDDPVAPTGTAAQTFCAISNPTVAGLAATGTGIKWYAASIGGTALATSTALVNGTHYYASQTVSGCESVNRFDVTVAVGNPVPPGGSTTQSFCAINNPTIANLSATGPGILWYAAASGGAVLATSTALVNGTHYYASQTVSACESISRLDVTVAVSNPLAPTGVAIQKFCAVNNPAVANLTATGTGILWYTTASGGAALATSTALVNGTHYYASQTISGCESINRLDVTVAVNPAPVANTITGLAAVCIGSTIPLTPHATGAATLTYTWSSSNTTVASVSNAGIVLGKATGSTNISYTVTDGNGCSATSPLFAVTVTKPVAGAITQASGAPAVCIAGTLSLLSNATGTAPLTYTWASSDNSKATVTNTGVVTGVVVGTVGITYTVTDGNGCSTTSPVYNVAVNPLPAGTLTATENSGVTPNDNIICTTAPVKFTATSGFGSYVFKVNGNIVQTGVSNIYNTSTLTDGASVTVDVANGFNCGATFGPVVITVKPLPVPGLSADQTTICPGDNVTFTATGGTNYVFKVNGSPVQSGPLNSFSSTSLTNGAAVTVDVTDGSSCTATFAPAITITWKPAPVGTLSASSTNICAGDNITFTATAGFASYEFSVAGSSVQGPGASNVFNSTSINNAEIVTVVVTSSSGCSVPFNAVPITVHTPPTVTITATENSGTPNDNKICAGANVTFTATAGLSNYDFRVNGASKQNGASNAYSNNTLVGGDIVSVIVKNANNCSATFNATPITIVLAPTGTLSALPSNNICIGDNVTFTATSGFTDYNFQVNGSTVLAGNFSTYSTNTLANGDVVRVKVTNSNGCTSTFGPINMIVNTLPSGTLAISENSGNLPDDGTICKGATVTFTAPAGFSNYDFLLNGATIQSGASRTFTTSSLINTDKVTVAVKNGSGCIKLLNSYTITVNPLPPVQPITGTLNVCINNTTALADATAGGAWSSLNPTIATVNASGVVTGVAAGSATINYKLTSSSGCDSTVKAVVTVNSLPVVASITGNAGVCVNSTTQLSDATNGGTWSSSNTGVATVSITGLVTGVSAGPATISYAVTNGNGCTTTATLALTVNPLPVPGAITGTLSVCVNATTALTNSSGGGAWSSGNTAIATVNSSTGLVTGVAAGTATITYTLTNGNGCTQTAMADVTVNALPVPTLTGPNPICLGSTDNVYTTETGGGIHNYIWNVVNGTKTAGGTTADNSVTVSWLSAGAKSISVNYTDGNGCAGATSATVVNAAGSSPTVTGPSSICQNSTGNIYTAPSGKEDYSWVVTGGTITGGGTGTDATVTVTWNNSGTQSVTINYAEPGGCSAATPTVYNVTVNPQPTLTLHDPATLCSPALANLTAAAVTAGSTAGLTYTYWTDAGATISYLTPASAGAGNYYIKGTTGSGCYDIKSIIVTINPSPTVVITNPAALCSPATVDITQPAITAGSTSGLTFSYWTNATATVSYSTPAAAVTGTYYIKGSTPEGCFDIQPVTVVVNATPTVVTHDPAAACSPATANLTLPAVTSGSTAGLTYTYWTDAAATSSYPTPAAAGSGIYYIKGTVSGCSDIKPVTVTINSLPVGGTVDGSASVCAAGNNGTLHLTGQTGGIVRWESSVDGGTTWVAIINTTDSYPYNNLLQSTEFRAIVQNGGCAEVNSASATITVNSASAGGSVGASATVCAGVNSGTLNLTGQTGSVTGWEFSIDGGTSWSPAPANTTTSQAYNNVTQTTLYRAVVQSGVCAIANSTAATIAINQRPTGFISGTQGICNGKTATLTLTVTGSGTISGTLSGGISFSGTAPAITVAVNPTINTTYTIATLNDANCTANAGDKTGSATVTVNGSTPIASVVASPAGICLGNSSNLFIPDVTSTLFSENFEGANTFTVTNTATAGTEWLLKNSPYIYSTITFNSGSHFMLTNSDKGTGGNNLTNTTLVSPTISTVGYSALNFQYKTHYRRISSDVAVVEVSTNNGASWAVVQDLTALGTTGAAATFATLNINLSAYVNKPTFQVRFRFTTNNQWYWAVDDISLTGTVTTADYSWTAVPAATSGLPGSAATPSPANASIVVTPSVLGPTVYTATLTNSSGCTSSRDVTLTVNPIPTVTITADYCTVPGMVKLTANATPGVTYLWSTGETTQSINVDVADDYQVTVTLGNGCPASAIISVAQENAANGDFTNGNTGFTSDYAYKADVAAVTNELLDDTGNNAYSITTDGQNVQSNFWGKDHTNNATGPRNFMLVNGHGNTLIIWKETVNVLPNTTYYFSAWAMSLNNLTPSAQLQFNINGTLLGTTAVLTPGVNDNSNNGWVRFYGNWTSGPTATTINISINDLQASGIGNDFGLDDISFGTLSTFVQLESAPGTDAQTVCANSPLVNIVYSVGSTASGPTIVGLPPGLSTSFNGELFTITGSPTVAGNYAYTVTTTGTCNPSSASGTITVEGQTITLGSGTSSPTACVNTPLAINFTFGGTATGATATGLPPGILPSVSGNTFTLSGTPTTEGVYPYIIITSGTKCTPVTIAGTITVQAQTITQNPPNASQVLCVNTPLTNIQFSVGGTATTASVAGLPSGVSGSYSGGLFIISGTPNATGVFNYTVTTLGSSCTGAQAFGSIEVTSGATLTLTSGPGTNVASSCKDAPMDEITYTVANATGAGVTGLPAGVIGTYNAGEFIISGTPTEGGEFTYTITTTGGCGSAIATGTLTVREQTVALTSGVASPSLCANTVLPSIVYTWGGTATTATLTGVPIGTTQTLSGNTLTIGGTLNDAAGPYTYTITTEGTCEPATATGIITLSPAPVGGTLASALLCSGSNGSITLSGQAGNILNWEVSTDGGATWSVITNTTITQSYTNIVQETMYRVAVGNSGCSTAYSTVATLRVHNVWTGSISNYWNTAGNWSGNAVPSMSCPDVFIPGAPSNQPILSGGAPATINNLHILAGALLTVNGTGILQIAGAITNTGGMFDASAGKVDFNGTTATGPQTIAAATFKDNAIKDLVISNSTAAGVALDGPLDVYHSLTYGAAGTVFTTNDNLTLKSNATGTAWIGNVTGHSITGSVMVERYIPARRAWRFLAVPTQTTQTIHDSWQEGQAPNSPTPTHLGIQITSDLGAINGFDLLSPFGPSMKTYNPGSNTYSGVTSTNAGFINALGGYMTFIRGDRTVRTPGQAAVYTVLRTKGTLFTGTQPAIILSPVVTPYMNPYAAPLDLRILSPNITTHYYVWDPNRGGLYGFGAFTALEWNSSTGNFDVIPAAGSPSYPGDIGNFIESGQAFLVSGSGSITIQENTKGVGSGATVFRPASPARGAEKKLHTNLYSVNTDSSTSIVDGILSVFGESYSNGVDGYDARKLSNMTENLAIRTNGNLLVVERKQPITREDTIFLNLTSVGVHGYQFKFEAENLNDGTEGFLEDNYLRTRTPLDLNGTTTVSFNIVNVPGGYAADRFRIVFKPAAVLPVTFTSIKAYRLGENINVEWTVENERGIKQYELEKSLNGTQFTRMAILPATAANGQTAGYFSIDTNPAEGYNYYRVKSLDVNDKTTYTSIVKVLVGSLKHDITINPNPITDGVIHLQFLNQPEGRYGIRLMNKLGQVIVSKQIDHAGGNSTELIKWDFTLSHGMYQLQVVKPNGGMKNINVLY